LLLVAIKVPLWFQIYWNRLVIRLFRISSSPI